MKSQEIKKILSQKIKPLSGNSRSFSMRATRRKFANNCQNFQVGSKNYQVPIKLFRTYWKRLKKGLYL